MGEKEVLWSPFQPSEKTDWVVTDGCDIGSKMGTTGGRRSYRGPSIKGVILCSPVADKQGAGRGKNLGGGKFLAGKAGLPLKLVSGQKRTTACER